MAAGLGFKDFTTGEVLTAADVDGYLMQGIWVFASAAARDAAVTSPQEGNACYLKDTNQVLTYSGSAWVAVGGGSPLTTKGDLYGFSTVDARIPIGANDTVLTADSTQSLGLKWATPAAGGGMTLLSTTTLSGASTTISSINQTYNTLFCVISGVTNNTSNTKFCVKPNGASVANYTLLDNDSLAALENEVIFMTGIATNTLRTSTANAYSLTINNYASATAFKPMLSYGRFLSSASANRSVANLGALTTTSAITSLEFLLASGDTFSAGTVLLYGVK